MSSSEEHLGLEREKAVEELIHGRDCVDRLRMAMENPSTSTEKEALLQKILASFTNTLSMLRSFEFDEVSQVPVASPSPDVRKSDDSGDSIQSSLPRNRRGCYKRRKSANSCSRDDSPSPYDDGHSWRKYGQKNILRSKHPRNYFRCTHKYDQKCQATKQVQKIRDDPPVFRTTYYGQHTCCDLLEAPHLILDDDAHARSIYLSFDPRGNDPFTFPVKPETTAHDLPPPVLDSSTASNYGAGATMEDNMDSFAFDDYNDDFSFDFS